MTRYVLVFVFLITGLLSKGQFQVKSVQENVVEYEKNKPVKKDREEKFYDASGNLVKQVFYDKNLKPNKVIEYQYKDGLLIKEIVKKGDNLKINEVVTYKYNDKGQKIEILKEDSQGKLLKRIVYTYDEKGLKKSKMVYNGKGELIEKTEYTYQYFKN
jgi:uncharacterized protein RhaS with RHS repeats